MSALATLTSKLVAELGLFLHSRSDRSMARGLYAVLVFGVLYAVLHGKLTGTPAATVLVALVSGLGAAWVAGKVAGGPPPTVTP